MSARTAIVAGVIAASLDLPRVEVAHRLAEARRAGWRGAEAANVVWLALRDPRWNRYADCGPEPRDEVTASIFRGSPARQCDGDSRLTSVVCSTGGKWRDGRPATRKKPKPDIATEAVRATARALAPGDDREARRARQRIRDALESGQSGFPGLGWGVPT